MKPQRLQWKHSTRSQLYTTCFKLRQPVTCPSPYALLQVGIPVHVLPHSHNVCVCLLSAAQCLQTITEDNPVAIQSITASSDLLTLLEGALTSYSHSSDSTQAAVVRVSLAGTGASLNPAFEHHCSHSLKTIALVNF